MTNLGVVLAEQTARTIQSVDLVLRDIQSRAADLGIQTPEEFRQHMSRDSAHRMLAEYLRNLPQAEKIAVTALYNYAGLNGPIELTAGKPGDSGSTN